MPRFTVLRYKHIRGVGLTVAPLFRTSDFHRVMRFVDMVRKNDGVGHKFTGDKYTIEDAELGITVLEFNAG